MARIGAFDRHLEPLAWWEAELIPAGWYVDELLVSQQGPPPAPSTKLWLRVGGVWKETTVYINVSGVWKPATPFIKISGTWRPANSPARFRRPGGVDSYIRPSSGTYFRA